MLMRQALEALCDDVGSYLRSDSILPRPKSPAAGELADTELADQLANAHHLGNLMLEAAADHSYALTRLLVEPVPTAAPSTCARGGLEASVISCWLLAEGVTARERVSRAFAYRYKTLREQQKLARSSDDQASLRRLEARLDEVESKALGLGYARVLDKHGARVGIGRAMPSTTDLVESLFGQETLYRIFCAMAHSQTTAMVQLGFLPFDDQLPTLMQKGMNSDAAAVLLMSATDSMAKPTWAKAKLFGLSMKRLVAILEKRYAEMGLNQSQFFWRHGTPS
jgi:hypothetical protein